MKRSLRDVGSVILGILFPERCVFCGDSTGSESYLCESCCAKIRPLYRVRTISSEAEETFFCLVPFLYKGKVRDGLIAYKFRGQEESFRYFGDVLAEGIRRQGSTGEWDWICNVPISSRRKRKRGFDQSQKIARRMGKKLHIPYKNLLKKKIDNRPQHALSALERKSNVENVYEVRNREKLQGKRILLVDDIVTTGNTLRECVETLLRAGASVVFCVAVASAGEEKLEEADGKSAPFWLH